MNRRSGADRLDTAGQAGNFPRRRILVHDALLGATHDLRLRGLQGLACRCLVAGCDGFFNFAHKGAYAAAPGFVDRSPPGYNPHCLLSRFRIRHVVFGPIPDGPQCSPSSGPNYAPYRTQAASKIKIARLYPRAPRASTAAVTPLRAILHHISGCGTEVCAFPQTPSFLRPGLDRQTLTETPGVRTARLPKEWFHRHGSRSPWSS